MWSERVQQPLVLTLDRFEMKTKLQLLQSLMERDFVVESGHCAPPELGKSRPSVAVRLATQPRVMTLHFSRHRRYECGGVETRDQARSDAGCNAM